jgi:hypothetical protein
MWHERFLEKLIVSEILKQFLTFMEPEVSTANKILPLDHVLSLIY